MNSQACFRGRPRLAGTSALAIAAALAASPALADCSPGPTSGDDLVTCDGTPDPAGANFNGFAGDDVISITAGSHGNIYGNWGNDTITISGGTVAMIQGDFVTEISLSIGGVGNDIINLFGGTVTGDVLGLDLNDTITLDGTAVGGSIYGSFSPIFAAAWAGFFNNNASDTFILTSGSVAGGVFGGNGADDFTLNGASITGALDGGGGADRFSLTSGSAGSVEGGAGSDLITLDGATIIGVIAGGAGNDTIDLRSGSAGSVDGGTGADLITLNGATINGALDGGAGDDTFTLTSGSAGSVQGGDGSDTVTLSGFDLAGIAGALDGGDDTSTADGFIDTLNFSTSGTIDGGRLLNWEVINLTAGQALQLTGAGLTTSSDTGYGFSIAGGAALSFGGNFTLTGNLTNAGVVDLSGTGATAGDVFTVTGNVGGSGMLVLDADFDAMTSDRLVVNGTISGTHGITINNLTPGSTGGPTGTGVGAGLVLVDNSAGPGVADGQFALSGGPITAGVFRFDLSTESDGILYLQSFLLGEAAAYGILGEVMRDVFPTLRERLGQRAYALDGSGVGQNVWTSISSDRRKVRPDETNPLNGGDWDENRREIAVGVDVARFPLGGGEVVGSLGLHVISSNATTFGTDLSTGHGDVSTQGLGLGGNLTWFGANDVYVDLQGRMTRWEMDAGSEDAAATTDGKSWGLSVEAGQRLGFGKAGALTPRMQVVWSQGRFDGFTDDSGTTVESGRAESLILSSGLTYERQLSGGTVLFADVAVFRDFADQTGVVSEGTTVLSGASDSWGKLSLGASLPVGDYGAAYLAARGSKSLDSGADLSVGFEGGLRIRF